MEKRDQWVARTCFQYTCANNILFFAYFDATAWLYSLANEKLCCTSMTIDGDFMYM